MNVLLIEDNELNRDMLTRRLERKEFIVSCAEDGQSGIDMAKNEMPDIILVIDGWNVARQLKADSNTKDIPIIALTAHAMKGDREKALDAGCDDYDTKPVNLEGLLDKMHKLTS